MTRKVSRENGSRLFICFERCIEILPCPRRLAAKTFADVLPQAVCASCTLPRRFMLCSEPFNHISAVESLFQQVLSFQKGEIFLHARQFSQKRCDRGEFGGAQIYLGAVTQTVIKVTG